MQQRILIVDDEPANINLLACMLDGEYELQSALCGEQALELMEQEAPELVLLDIMMPGMDGYEVCRRLKANKKLQNIPVVFVTALGDTVSESAGLGLGAADYLSKPINVELARQRIRNLLEREQLRKEVEAQRDQLEAKVAERSLALSIAKEAAESASRAKSVFLATMSHELRTPMNGIMGLTEILKRKITDPQQIDYLAKISKASNQLLAIINDILDMSKIQAEHFGLKRIDFNLGDVLQDLEDLTAQKAREKGLALVIHIEAGLADRLLHGDSKRLGQVLFNLTNNAIKFTSSGSVTVATSVSEEMSEYLLVRFDVTDTGIGILPEDQKRIFAPFEQADGSTTRKYGGTGLGLAISKRLIQAMGGVMELESQIGIGSMFWLTVPLNKIK